MSVETTTPPAAVAVRTRRMWRCELCFATTGRWRVYTSEGFYRHHTSTHSKAVQQSKVEVEVQIDAEDKIHCPACGVFFSSGRHPVHTCLALAAEYQKVVHKKRSKVEKLAPAEPTDDDAESEEHSFDTLPILPPAPLRMPIPPPPQMPKPSAAPEAVAVVTSSASKKRPLEAPVLSEMEIEALGWKREDPVNLALASLSETPSSQWLFLPENGIRTVGMLIRIGEARINERYEAQLDTEPKRSAVAALFSCGAFQKK